MAGTIAGREVVVPDFESVEALRAGLDAKANFEAINLYPRDGSELLGEVEAHLAGLTHVEPEHLLAYGSGMSAVTDAIDVALTASQVERPRLLCARETYTQTKRYIENFVRGKQAEVIYFDSGSTAAIERLFHVQAPDVIVTETISNYVNVPVLNTEHFFDAARSAEVQPVIVLDNTLPLTTALDLGSYLAEDDQVIVVESGTKNYTFNKEALGIAFTKNETLRNYLLRLRRTRGSLPCTSGLEVISDLLPDESDFKARSRQIFGNTAIIAREIAAAADGRCDYIISHPTLPSHDNHDYYAERFPEGASPVFYLQSIKHDQYEVATKLWAHPGVREQAKLGQSFGFDETRIVADENIGAVRIAGGAYTHAESLGRACAEALFNE